MIIFIGIFIIICLLAYCLSGESYSSPSMNKNNEVVCKSYSKEDIEYLRKNLFK